MSASATSRMITTAPKSAGAGLRKTSMRAPGAHPSWTETSLSALPLGRLGLRQHLIKSRHLRAAGR